jgi:rubrerythrin
MTIEEKNGKLVIMDFNECEAYKIASRIEKDGILFYKKLKEKLSKPQIKSVIDFLIQEEEKHLKLFQDLLYDMLRNREDYDEDEDLLDSMDFGIFRTYQSIEELDKVVGDTAKALRLGLAIENKSVVFYEAAKSLTRLEAAQKELSRIIDEEKKHKALLEDMLSI